MGGVQSHHFQGLPANGYSKYQQVKLKENPDKECHEKIKWGTKIDFIQENNLPVCLIGFVEDCCKYYGAFIDKDGDVDVCALPEEWFEKDESIDTELRMVVEKEEEKECRRESIKETFSAKRELTIVERLERIEKQLGLE